MLDLLPFMQQIHSDAQWVVSGPPGASRMLGHPPRIGTLPPGHRE